MDGGLSSCSSTAVLECLCHSLFPHKPTLYFFWKDPHLYYLCIYHNIYGLGSLSIRRTVVLFLYLCLAQFTAGTFLFPLFSFPVFLCVSPPPGGSGGRGMSLYTNSTVIYCTVLYVGSSPMIVFGF